MKERVHNFNEVLFYVGYTISVYYMSHFGIGKDVVVDSKYRFFSWLLITTTLLLFKSKSVEITKEIFKSGLILILCQIIDTRLFGKQVDMNEFIYIIFAQIIWQLVSFVMAHIYRAYYTDHGKYTDRFLLICSLVSCIMLFILKMNICINIIIIIFVILFVGLYYNIKFNQDKLIEVQQSEIKIKSEIEEEKRRERELFNLREENKMLIDKNKELCQTIALLETKQKRKSKRKNRSYNKFIKREKEKYSASEQNHV